MTEQIWHDLVTGSSYRCTNGWLQQVHKHIAEQLRARLTAFSPDEDGYRGAADTVARFWRIEYYQQIFPLRFSLSNDNGAIDAVIDKIPADEEILLGENMGSLRSAFLDANALPPILPDPDFGKKEGWLLSDRLLVLSAAVGTVLVGSGNNELRQQARLAALTYPFRETLGDLPIVQGEVARIGQIFQSQPSSNNLAETIGQVVSTIQPEVVDAGTRQVGLVAMSVQRIKQYVFETDGLNEIRGASTLLNDVIDELSNEVATELGPEVILRAAGSMLLFMAPINDALEGRASKLRRYVYAKTGSAFATAGTVEVSLQELVADRYGQIVGEIFAEMNLDRAEANLPYFNTYPFEMRCRLCSTRAADRWHPNAENELTPVCSVCLTKRERGREGRRGKVIDILEQLGVLDSTSESQQVIKTLGVKGADQDDWVANELGDLVYEEARRRLVGVVYGDGNNFGVVGMKLPSLALGFQWTARVEYTTMAAAAIALGKATQQMVSRISKGRGWHPGNAPVLAKVPFQVLAIGGDDISLFAAAPVAMEFAAEFTELTDLELRATSKCRLLYECRIGEEPRDEPLHFSVGVLITDEKTPVRKSINFVEDELLKWAKKANKVQKLSQGNITMLYAETAESVPSDLEAYRADTFLLGAKNGFNLATTLRPYSALELRMLLATAAYIRREGDLGRLERLVSAFYGARQGVMAGMLYYAYQKGRTANQKNGGWIHRLEQQLNQEMASGPLIDYRVEKDEERPIFGLPNDPDLPRQTNYSPIGDLLELTKMMT